MKKISLLFAMLLVLVSSIVFCSCGGGYKNLKIECKTKEISLVLDDKDLSTTKNPIIFELSGAKSWGEISITSKPIGLVQIAYEIEGKKCAVAVEALQPSGDGASLEIKHLGSGKSLSVPLKIGRKLSSITNSGKDFVIQLPKFETNKEDGVNENGDDEQIYEIQIPTKELLNCYPANYTDNIVWQSSDANLPTGIKLVSYNKSGGETQTFNDDGSGDDKKRKGSSSAVKTVIIIDNTCRNEASIEINPVSVLDNEATLHKDITINVNIIDLLKSDSIKPFSEIHGNSDGMLKDLVLISNPDPNNPREDSVAYDYYSTTVIDFKLSMEDDFKSLLEVNEKYSELYQMELSTNIEGLRLENIEFGKIRAIATSTCVGEGEIVVKFVPNECVGDIQAFSINVPCVVGERPTSFAVRNNGNLVEINKINEYTFESIVPLNDSQSLGQAFKFELLSTHTLPALSSYKISIDKNLLYINTDFVDPDAQTSKFIRNSDNSGYFDLSGLNKYDYQIAILKDGREITFYEDGDNFISEFLSSSNTIYIKWVKTDGTNSVANADFGISISTFYNTAYRNYDILNHGFDKMSITYNLDFNRQRMVESVSYTPSKVVRNDSWEVQGADDAGYDWQFYFEPTMFDNKMTLYGLSVDEILGINSTALTDAELNNINLEISINNSNLGFALLDIRSINVNEVGGGFTYTNSYMFNFDSDEYNLNRNIVLIGKIGYENVAYGDYEITISQNKRIIAIIHLKVYKNLEDKDINVSIPTADFSGEYLTYQKLNEKPEDWSETYNTYYEYVAGQYVNVGNHTWNTNKTYYKKVDIKILIGNENKTIDINNTYILATSKQYMVNIDITNEDFVSISNQSVQPVVVGASTELLGVEYINNLCANDTQGNNILKTGTKGLFNTKTGEKNYIQLTYKISAQTYDYYKLNTDKFNTIDKVIYIYVYEPLTFAKFDHTMIYKYDINSIPNAKLKEEYGKQTLNIELNDNSVLDYVDIQWKTGGDGLAGFTLNAKDRATYSFVSARGNMVSSTIIATLTQFGVQYPISCGYIVRNPILSEEVVLNNSTYNFKSGDAFINLKVGESINIDAIARSSNGDVSIEGFEYIVCSTTGYSIDSIARIDDNGKLVGVNSGRAKLIIVAKDVVKTDLSSVTNYFKTRDYIYNNAYVMVDILVSDGSVNYPYLIADATSFKAIQEDITNGNNNKHYALVNDINLNGAMINFSVFEGRISSFQEDESANNRFKIYGVMLTENNPNIFKQIDAREDSLANLENIDFYVDINYIARKTNQNEVLIGLVGTNNGLINNITITINGNINANNLSNNYKIGSICANNVGTIIIDNTALVGVQGQVIVNNSVLSTVVLGGVIGRNEGKLIGANTEPTISTSGEDVEYEVYYDNQGATADVVLQVKGVGSLNNSAVGGAIGHNNNGTMSNVYVMGKVLGVDDTNNLVVNNVGGLIGKNDSLLIINAIVKKPSNTDIDSVESILFDATAQFQVINSYANAQVFGNNNVGGAIGLDNQGSYKKVYYEIYSLQESIKANNNVGGLIGSAKDSNLYYCYANSFAWNYSTSVDVYDIIGNANVGGLIGLAESSRESFTQQTYNYSAMNIVSSLASVSLNGKINVSGLVGRLNGFGAIYTAYYYGVINPQEVSSPITKMYNNGNVVLNVPYNNVYSIVNGTERVDDTLYTGAGFGIDEQYNNGKPYIVYTYIDEDERIITNLISVVPTIIQVNQAFDTYYNDSSMYRQNSLGDYIWDNNQNKYIVYNPLIHEGMTRYSLMASLVETGDIAGNFSDYRTHALVLYYYQFSDMSNENALNDLYLLNTINMHDIVNDKGIIVLPNTFKRFNLRSSNNNIVSVLTGGRLLLRSEGQVVITLISTRNPSVTASFVVIVRSKVLEFNLYSSANLRNEYNIEGTTINIVKNTSKLIYVDYSSIIQVYNRKYVYKPATNMEVDFVIDYNGQDENILDGTKPITDYIRLNGVYNEESGVYTIVYGTPITISVNEYVDGQFTISATPYVIVDYMNGEYSQKVRVGLSSYFVTSFNVVTKKGATAINTDKTQIDMMPADEPSNLDIKINTDIKIDKLYFEIKAVGQVFEVVDVNNPLNVIQCKEMLDVIYGGNKINLISNEENSFGELDLSDIELKDMLQTLSLTLKLNDKSHYVDVAFRLQIKLIVKNGSQEVTSIVHIDVKPQEISSLMALNYRMEDGREDLSLENTYLSQVIRPGSANIITIDIAPSIAVYDYVEIVDTTTEDKILFQQVNEDLSSLDNMDTWVDNGIKLDKYNARTSKLYVIAKLPLYATANITHTIQIVVYDKDGKILTTSYLNLEAVMYPTIVMTYTYPNGQSVVADTRRGNAQQIVVSNADLAVGVEASINIATYNIDDGSLQGYITIKDEDNNIVENSGYVQLAYSYGDYVLRFNVNNKDNWDSLVDKNIEVTFTAYKKLNGITETCSATISFNIRRIVVHNISMTHTSSSGELYGDWGEEFTTQFYFDKTDISYYNNGYWNVQYTLDNTSNLNMVDEQLNKDFAAINNILVGLNKLGSKGVKLYLVNKQGNQIVTELSSNYSQDGVLINNKDNNCFVIKAQEDSNINNMELRVEYKLQFNTQNYPELSNAEYSTTYIKELGFNITKKTTPFDEYLTVSNQQEFEEMLEGKYYRLTNDITLIDYTPRNTAIGGLNGDGYTLTIDEFNETQLIQDYISSGMYVGLFGTLAEDSVIQNLQVNYDNIILNLNDRTTIQEQHTNNIYFGGIAGINLGVITNVKVIGSFKLISQYISAEQITLGGITANNGSSESSKVATITGSTVEMNLSAMALIGGISGTNRGKITNTNFKGTITSNEANEYASNIFTAGLVVENSSGAYISLSYVECGLDVNSYNIHSVGRTAGFVFNNSGTINNSYINQTSIRSQGNIGGFVYQSSGEINNCYAYPTLGNSLFYQEFIYSTTNVGKISNCYVITDSTKNINVSGLKAIKTIKVASEEEYDGFIFAKRENGVWSLQDNGPHLETAGFNHNQYEYNNIYNIYDVETFEGYFNTSGDIIEGKNYRIVRDIDFESGGLDGNPITFSKTLKASIEGNDMALLNYNIYKIGDIDSIGLFANIETVGLGIYVRNLILKPSSIKATGSIAVGALAGIIDSADVYNIKIDNQSLLILGKNVVGGLAGIIKGDFEIIGITSNVSTFATYAHNLGQQYNLYTGKNVTNSILLDNIGEVSYAGSVAGIVNGYNASRMDMENRSIDSYYSISDITLDGNLVIIGETVGGAFGLVGERTVVKNLNYNLASETLYQGIYVSGGLVGENRGIVQDSSIMAYDNSKERVSTTNCFNKYARINGGIVGLNIGGLVNNCTSDIDVCTAKDLATAGGIVGRNIEGSIYYCSIYGNLDAYFVGGIVGTDYSYSTIIQQETGHGTATLNSRRVYSNIQNKVKYDGSCVFNYDNTKLYKGNVITNEFLTRFMAKKNKYYTFNTSYIDNPVNNLATTTAVFGLVVGLTNNCYNISVICGDKSVNYSNNGLVVDLASGEQSQRAEYTLKYNDIDYIVKPIANIIAPDFDFGVTFPGNSTEVLFLYLIAFDNASYEFWSSTLGYTQQYIAMTKEALQ